MAKKVYRASDFRYANILPNPVIDEVAGLEVKAIRFKPEFSRFEKWWEFEKHIEIDFQNSTRSQTDDIYSLCSSCGLCCKDIPTHQIGIYMSPKEVLIATEAGHDVKTQGQVQVEGVQFQVLAVDEKGDCKMLGEKGCTLNEKKPLWCKIYHCEKFQGREYMFKKRG